MKHADFEAALWQSLHQGCGTEQMEAVVLLARKEARRRRRISFWQLLKKQTVFLGWKLWLSQGLALLGILWQLSHLYGRHFWEGPLLAMRMLSCLSVLVAMMALPLLYRTVRCRMQEIEAATYFSSVRLLLARLLVIGAGDLGLLLGIAAAAAAQTSLQAGSISLSLGLPFLAVSGGSLYMLGHWKAERYFAGSLGLGAGVLLVTLFIPGRFFPDAAGIWLAVCGILLIFCLGQVHYLFAQSPYAELQI